MIADLNAMTNVQELPAFTGCLRRGALGVAADIERESPTSIAEMRAQASFRARHEYRRKSSLFSAKTRFMSMPSSLMLFLCRQEALPFTDATTLRKMKAVTYIAALPHKAPLLQDALMLDRAGSMNGYFCCWARHAGGAFSMPRRYNARFHLPRFKLAARSAH